MYKIFVDNSDNEMVLKLSKEIQRILLTYDNCIVYEYNNKNETKEKLLSDIELNAYVYIQENADGKGPEVILDEENNKANGIGKEVYKEIKKIYNCKDIDKGLIYMNNLFGNELKNIPAIKINIVDINDQDDIRWLDESKNSVAQAISNGIIKSFGLKFC